MARQLHRLSRRQHGPFVAVNCAAIVESLLEAELLPAGAAFTRTASFVSLNTAIFIPDGMTSTVSSTCLAPAGSRFADEVLFCARSRGRGLLLIPSAFAVSSVYSLLGARWQPSLSYGARGLANLWGEAPPAPSEALRTLLGAGRAAVLLSLCAPKTNGDLARRLGVTAAAVSQHLGVLRRTGLVEPRRRGRSVYFGLSPAGEALLAVFDGLGPHPSGPAELALQDIA